MKLNELLKKRSGFKEFDKIELFRKLFAIFVIMMFMSSGVSLEVVAASEGGGGGSITEEEANAQNEEKGFEERELKDEDYSNADAYEGNPPKIFTNPKFDVTKVPTDRVEQHIDAIIGTGKQNSLTQDQVRAISDPGKVSTLLQNMDPANIQRFSPAQIGSLSTEQLTSLKPEQRAALTAEQLSNGNVLVNVGNWRDLHPANLNAAMKTRYGLAEGALFLISSGAGDVLITA
ncbi:hypothetical protein HYU06_02585, partial [Candidatus Woesearchaeota archaeon]|nr:hypothetical protein [Candidatus Woesearchaeota archaeon]